jgi:anti-sigma factor RsiW
MNVHDEWTERLSEFLDGELAADEQRSVEAHLRECADCATVLTDLRRVVARAQQAGAVPRPPGADLWSGIAARIDAERGAAADRRRPIAFAPRAARRVSFTLPQLAAAAALIAAVSGGIVWTMRPAPAVAQSAPAAAPERATAPDFAAAERGDRVVPVGMADAQYDAAVSDLESALKRGRGRLDTSTIATVEHNLQIIDQAIEQARDALAADPANTYLSGHLVEARRRKLDLLRRAAALTTESD